MDIFTFYNVENLFLPDHKPKNKFERPNSGLVNWDSRKYQYKLNKISNVFRLIEEQDGCLPFMIGLAEVSGAQVLKDLTQIEPLKNRYGILHYNSLDERKVDVALLYDLSKIEVVDSEPITFFFEESHLEKKYFDTTRDVLYAKVRFKQEIINVFVLHLPSKREKDINKPKREYILQEIRTRINTILHQSDEKIIICGDFNENPNDDMMLQFSQSGTEKFSVRNPFLSLYKGRKYSVYHHNQGLLFDQILLSENFFSSSSALCFEGAEVFIHKNLCAGNTKNATRPYRTYAGSRYLGGYSDHFPVCVKLK